MDIRINQITRAIAHEVVKITRGAPPARPAVVSNSLLSLEDREAEELMRSRLIATFGQGSKCVDVQVEAPTAFNDLTFMLDAADQDFINRSQTLASSLSNAQTAGSIKAGVAIFMQGVCFYDGQELRFIAVIKADPDQALRKTITNGIIRLDYVNNLLFGNSQRLLKIALLIEEQRETANRATAQRVPEDFAIKVFDHLMDNSSDNNAAAYFYRTFLGCRLAENSAVKSRQFFDITETFIMSSPNLTQEQKEVCRGGLFSLMRGNTEIIEPAAVAREILPPAIHDDYIAYCGSEGITEAFSKDNSLIANKLKKRTIKFSSRVTLYAQTDILRDNVKIENQDAEGWTLVKIRGNTVK